MTAGIPGAGIGGLFYLLNALWMPIREIGLAVEGRSSAASRRVVWRQSAIAAGILLGIGVTAQFIGIVLSPEGAFASASATVLGIKTTEAPRVLSYSTFVVSALTMILILGTVQLLRLVVRPRRHHIVVLAMLTFASAGLAQEALNESRAVYLQAQELERSRPEEAEQLYRRYIQMEPADPWGYIVLAEFIGRAGRYEDALELYDQAAKGAPTERDAMVGRARMLARAGKTDRAIAELELWATHHLEDSETWNLLSRERQRAGRLGGALAAAEHAYNLTPDGAFADRLDYLRGARAPALQPRVSYSLDSDGNRRMQTRVHGDFAVADAARLGLSVGRTEVSDSVGQQNFKDFTVSSTFRPRTGMLIEAAGGAVDAARFIPTARFRLRASVPADKLKIDLRFNRSLLDATPALVRNEILRNDLQVRPEVRAGGALRLRGVGGVAWMRGGGEENQRQTMGGGVALNLAQAIEVSGNFTQSRYRQPSYVGYFAPERIQTMEGGTYMEFETGSSLIALDFGAGAERFREHGSAFGAWRPVIRGYALLSFRIRPGKEVGFEIDSYNSQAGPTISPTSGWKYASVEAYFHFALR